MQDKVVVITGGSSGIGKALAEEYMGQENVIDLPIRMTGEDFSYYTHVVPGCFYRLGTSGADGSSHHLLLEISPEPEQGETGKQKLLQHLAKNCIYLIPLPHQTKR